MTASGEPSQLKQSLFPYSPLVPLGHEFTQTAPDHPWSESLDWSGRLQRMGVLHDPLLIGAFQQIRRYDFLPPAQVMHWGKNGPLPISNGQFNSEPQIVGMMLQHLDLQEGDRVLDFGAGSGWTTALLAARVGRTGQVIGTEVVSELVEFGKANVAKYDLPHAAIIQTEDRLGHPDGGPYDKILVSARIPMIWLRELLVQLEDGGRLEAPVSRSMRDFKDGRRSQQLMVFTRRSDRFASEIVFRSVAFVPTVRPQPT